MPGCCWKREHIAPSKQMVSPENSGVPTQELETTLRNSCWKTDENGILIAGLVTVNLYVYIYIYIYIYIHMYVCMYVYI